jgi:hypothetical protein
MNFLKIGLLLAVGVAAAALVMVCNGSPLAPQVSRVLDGKRGSSAASQPEIVETSVSASRLGVDGLAARSLSSAFHSTAISERLKSLPDSLGLQHLGPLSEATLATTMESVSNALSSASHRLAQHCAVVNPDTNTLWAIHQKKFTCLKYTCELACLQAGLYWTFSPGRSLALNERMNVLTDDQCWFIHLSEREDNGRKIVVVVYVPHELFPEIHLQRQEQREFMANTGMAPAK